MEKDAMKVLFKFIKSLGKSKILKFVPTLLVTGGIKSIKVVPELKKPDKPIEEKIKMDDYTFAVYYDKEGVTIYDKSRNPRLNMTWNFWKVITAPPEETTTEAPKTAP